MATRQISETIDDIYGFEASEGFISDVTDKLLPQIEEWQNRPLDEIYPVMFIDAIHYSVRDNGIIRKLAAYVVLGINLEGRKEVLTIEFPPIPPKASLRPFLFIRLFLSETFYSATRTSQPALRERFCLSRLYPAYCLILFIIAYSLDSDI